MYIFISYINWHYTVALRDVTRVLFNLLWFFWRLFSVPELALNILSPFQRLDEKPVRGASIGDRGGLIIVNVLMRIVGAIARLPIIAMGVVSSALMMSIILIAYPLWILAPILIPSSIFAGFALIFQMI
jgi:hypothetical protein